MVGDSLAIVNDTAIDNVAVRMVMVVEYRLHNLGILFCSSFQICHNALSLYCAKVIRRNQNLKSPSTSINKLNVLIVY